MWFRSHAASIRGRSLRWEIAVDVRDVIQPQSLSQLIHEAKSGPYGVLTSLTSELWIDWGEEDAPKKFLNKMHSLSLQARAVCHPESTVLRKSHETLIQDFSDVQRTLLQQRM